MITAYKTTSLNNHRNPEKFIILSGMTGTGKTDIMLQLETGIDLEGAANHKGSSFGRPLNGQPAQIDVENRIALDLLKVENKPPQQNRHPRGRKPQYWRPPPAPLPCRFDGKEPYSSD